MAMRAVNYSSWQRRWYAAPRTAPNSNVRSNQKHDPADALGSAGPCSLRAAPGKGGQKTGAAHNTGMACTAPLGSMLGIYLAGRFRDALIFLNRRDTRGITGMGAEQTS